MSERGPLDVACLIKGPARSCKQLLLRSERMRAVGPASGIEAAQPSPVWQNAIDLPMDPLSVAGWGCGLVRCTQGHDPKKALHTDRILSLLIRIGVEVGLVWYLGAL
jgi:hypothetical protein